MQLRCITEQNRKEMLNALVWVCILPILRVYVGVEGCLHVYRQKKTLINHAHTH